MQTTYRLKAQEITMTFLKSVKTLFAGHEVEIVIKSVDSKEKKSSADRMPLLEMINENRQKAPVISPDIDVRGLIDNAQYPTE